jgi:hypothetical protein
MKTTSLFFTMAAMAAAVMASCTTGEHEVVNNGKPIDEHVGERVAVQFASEVAELGTRVHDQTWDGGEHIGIFMLGNGQPLATATILESADNVEYQTASAGLTTASFNPSSGVEPIYYPVTGSVNFIAYYPYAAAATGTPFSLPVSVASQSSQSAIDVLYAHATTAYDKNMTGAVTLPFEHRLVKLRFNISNDESVTASQDGLTVTITGLNTQATLDLATGNVTSPATPTPITALTALNGLTSEAIVLPLGDNSGVTLTFSNTAGEEYTSVVPDISGNTAWESGKVYTYTVELKKNGISIEGSITPWGDGGTGSGTAE